MEPAENLISTLFEFLFIMFAGFTLSLIVVKTIKHTNVRMFSTQYLKKWNILLSWIQ